MAGAEEVVDDANRLTGRAWRVVAPLTVGYQNGAYLIEDDDGQYVLKWSPRPEWAERVAKAARFVEAARAQGYPTPAWIAQGVTTGGLPFHVQEFVHGEGPDITDDKHVAEILRVTELQRHISFEGSVDWTWYVEDVVYNHHAGHQTDLTAAGEATAAAVREALSLAALHEPTALPRTEMVHGDFSLDNVLMRDDRIVAVIDIEAIGSGCASFDLLTPARQDYIWGNRTVGPRFMQEAIRRDGAPYVSLAVAAHSINILAFGLDHWPAENVQNAAVDVIAWIQACRSLV